MKATLNTQVIVRLTEYGEKCLRQYGTALLSEAQQAAWRDVGLMKDGRRKFMLWECMAIFGVGLYHGAAEIPFYDNELEILE